MTLEDTDLGLQATGGLQAKPALSTQGLAPQDLQPQDRCVNLITCHSVRERCRDSLLSASPYPELHSIPHVITLPG